eukprot:NODE_7684_length_750_cov_22.516746_g7434_i0.p1 GENE.NODE_7684_length_750_cov_22.516746_g7434_i0~~NODE_7684_length_750_cov_22.516746_g7434_i0.p1  ORF type:complete len:168 (-),score=37.18 NODE_7684_length_750_cov_22.516746_g7434_i0:245-697(-)
MLSLFTRSPVSSSGPSSAMPATTACDAQLEMQSNWMELSMLRAPSRQLIITNSPKKSNAAKKIAENDSSLIKVKADVQNWNELRMLRPDTSSQAIATIPPRTMSEPTTPTSAPLSSRSSVLPSWSTKNYLPPMGILTPQQKAEVVNGNFW